MLLENPVAFFDKKKFSIGKLKCHSADTARKSLGSILIDASSLSEASKYFTEDHLDTKQIDYLLHPTHTNDGSFLMLREAMLNFVQNLIIFDRLYVDSPLLYFDEALYETCNRFRNILTPIHITIRERIDIINHFTDEFPDLYNIAKDLSDKYEASANHADSDENNHYQRVCSKYYSFDGKSSYFLRNLKDNPNERLPVWIPSFMKSSSNPGTRPIRTIFYLAYSKFLFTPYYSHPGRTPIIMELMAKQSGVAEKLLNLFEEKVVDPIMYEQIPNDFKFFEYKVPLVAEHILLRARKKGNLTEVILDVRNSKSAKRYRSFCREIEELMKLGRSGLRDQQRLFKELNIVFSKWASDLDEEVKYRTKKMSLSITNSILRVGSETSIKDPLLWSKYPNLIFLNNLLRSRKIERLCRKLDRRIVKYLHRDLKFSTSDTNTDPNSRILHYPKDIENN